MADAWSGVTTAGEVVALTQAIRDVYSMDILHEAMGIMRFAEFAVYREDLMIEAGQTVKFTKYSNITAGGALTESSNLEAVNMTASQISATVTEYGNAVGIREKLLQVNWHDTLSEAATLLGRDYALVTDLMLRDAVEAVTTNVRYGGGKASRALMDGASDFFDIELIRTAVELLQTANAPKYNGDYYVGFIHPHQAAYLKRDPDWISANNYANTRRLFNGEIGRWEDVVFISTTHMSNGAVASTHPAYKAALVDGATGGASDADVYQAAIMSDSSYAHAVALPVELRDNGVQDYARKHGLAWYAIQGAKVLDENFIVLLETV